MSLSLEVNGDDTTTAAAAAGRKRINTPTKYRLSNNIVCKSNRLP